MLTPLPQLRPEAVMQPFPAKAAAGDYLVAVDDRHFVVNAAVAAVLEEIRNLSISEQTLEILTHRVNLRLASQLSCQQIKDLLEKQLPTRLFLNSVDPPDDKGPLHLRQLLFTAPQIHRVVGFLAHLFSLRVAAWICFTTTALLGWFFFIAESAVIQHQSIIAVVLSVTLVLIGALLHELGHLAACQRFAAPHGGIGLGIYWFMPALYAEVHHAWLLPPKQRAIVDLGGIYVQTLFTSVLALIYAAIGSSVLSTALSTAIIWNCFLMLHTLNPVLKYDGYWLLSDLSGRYNLHQQIRLDLLALWTKRTLPRKDGLILLTFCGLSVLYFIYVAQLLGSQLGHSSALWLEMLATAPLPRYENSQFWTTSLTLLLLIFITVGLTIQLGQSLGSLIRSARNSS
jgi:putative peptide zinc metalloprotease protein